MLILYYYYTLIILFRSDGDRANGSKEASFGVSASQFEISSPEHANGLESQSGRPQKQNMLVFMVGGLSFIEIAALRFLSKDASFPYNIIMGTTNIINGNTLLESLVHDSHL